MKNSLLSFILIVLVTTTSFAQVAINETGAAPNSSAILDLSSNNKGLLIPRMTTNNRTTNVTAVAGLLVFDTDTDSFWYYDGTQSNWVEVITKGAMGINGLSDGIYVGKSLFLGDSAGVNDNGADNYNTGLGYMSLNANTNGIRNTSIGFNTNGSNTSGNSNTAIGYNAFSNNITGNNNTAIGSFSGPGSAADNLSGCIYIGFTAGSGNTSSSKLFIDNSGTSTPLIGGDFNANQVDINGTIKITGGTPGSGKVLTSDADGVASWGAAGASEIDDLSDARIFNSSLFLGEDAGSGLGGHYNTGIGLGALQAITNGNNSTAIGYNALNANTFGGSNVAIGEECLFENVSGDNNVAIGSLSGKQGEDGDYNVLIGYASGYKGPSSASVIIGNQAGYNTTSYHNVFLGFKAGYNNATGHSNVFLGYLAGFNETGSEKLYIDNSATSTPLIGGDFSTNQVNINGTIKITGGTPGSGKVLTSDTDGDATWETPTTYASSINDLSDAIYDGMSIFLGVGSGVNDDGFNSNTSIGHYSLSNNTSGIYNTATGYQALRANTTGSNNSAFGLESLESNIAGNSNSAYGFQSLNLNTSGNDNVGMGYNVLFYNSTGSSNTAIGVMAGQGVSGNNFSGCVFLGYNAGLNNTSNNQLYIDNSGTSTPLIGGNFSSNQVNINGTIKITGGTPESGKVLTSDADGLATWETPTVYASAINDLSDASSIGTRMFMGTNAGINNTGSYNTGVGYESLKLNSSGTYNTAFGFKTLDANTEGIGNTGMGHGSLGANTTGDYNTAIGREALDANTTGNYNTAVGFNAFPSGTFSNSVAIGYNASISANNQIHLGNTSITEIKGQVAFTTYSDGRIKENIKEDVSGLDFILKLRPVTYNINLDKENQLLGIDNQTDFSGKYDIEKVKRSGFIAQEVEVAANSTNYDFSGVQKPKNEKDLYGLTYAEFVVPLVKGMQEQQQQIKTLKTENTELKARLDRLEKLINQR